MLIRVDLRVSLGRDRLRGPDRRFVTKAVGNWGRVPEKHVHPRIEQLLLRLHDRNAEQPPAGESTRPETPFVQQRSKTFNDVKQPEEAVASGANKHPRRAFGGLPLSPKRRTRQTVAS